MDSSRRNFLRLGALAGAALAASRAPSSAGAESPAPRSGLALRVAGYDLDRVRGLVDGSVPIEGCHFDFEVAKIGDMNTDVFSGPQSRDVTEIGLSPFMLAWANEGFRDYLLLPAFPLRAFRHKSIFVRAASGIQQPEDLIGRKVATPGFSSTSLTWIRGFLQHEHGVRPDQIEWVVSAKDSSAGAAGAASRQENVVPEGLSVSRGPAGKDESELLVDGDVDGLLHAAEPRAFAQGDPRVKRLFEDSRGAERSYFAKTGIFPIMHAVAIKRSTADANPWLPEAVFRAYGTAKRRNQARMQKLGWAEISLPWFAQELESTRELMGDDFWPYGITRNRKALEALFQYSHEQGLAKRRLKVEEIFHPATLELAEI